MLKKIKNLFSKQPETLTLPKGEVISYCEKLHADYVSEVLEKEIQKITLTIEEIKQEINEKMTLLQEAKLKNENIPPKELLLMKGNRESYGNHIRVFLQQLTVPSTYSEINEQYTQFQDQIKYFVQHTAKARHVLSHFFKHEENVVHKSIGKLSKEFEHFHQLVTNDTYKQHKKLLTLLTKKEHMKERKKTIVKELAELQQLLATTKKEIIRLKELHEQKLSSEEYKKLQQVSSELQQQEAIYQKHKESINTLFSKFTRALKKYERSAMDNSATVEQLLSHPFEAIVKGQPVEKVLSSLQQSLVQKRIDIKNPEKVIQELDVLLKEKTISSLQQKLPLISKQITDLRQQKEETTIGKEIDDIQAQLILQEKKDHETQSKIEEMTTEQKSLSDEDILKQLILVLETIKGKTISIT